jgi:ATP-dependent helicase/nuclease subunit B
LPASIWSKWLEWVELKLCAFDGREPVGIEKSGQMDVRGVTIHGKADRIDAMADGTLAIVDYKTGKPPSSVKVQDGYALQLGTLGLIARAGGFDGIAGEPSLFEYWSLGKSDESATGFGYITSPLKTERKKTGIEPEHFLPEIERFLNDALDRWILGSEAFTARLNTDAPGYDTYDQLMRLAEWQGRESGG